MNNIPKRKGGVVFWDEDTVAVEAKTTKKPSSVAVKEDNYNGEKEAELYAKIASLEEELRLRDEQIAQLKETIDKLPEQEAPEANDPPLQEPQPEKTGNKSILLAAAAAVAAIMVLNS